MAKKMGGGGHKSGGGGSPIMTILLLAMVLAVAVGGFMVFKKWKAAQEAPPPVDMVDPANDPNAVPMTQVLVAQEEVHTYEAVTEYNVAVQEVPANSVFPEAALTALPTTDGSVVFGLDILPNTIITESMLWDTTKDEDLDKTARTLTINYVTTTTKLAKGDYIDIRIKKTVTKDNMTYSDEVVLAKKLILAVSGNQITMNLDEREQMVMSIASVDKTFTNSNSQIMNNQKVDIYCTKYATPNLPAATENYDNEIIRQQLATNPMLVEMALNGQLTGNEGIDISGGQQVPVQQETPTVDANGNPILAWTENGQPVIGYDANNNPLIGTLPQTQDPAQNPVQGQTQTQGSLDPNQTGTLPVDPSQTGTLPVDPNQAGTQSTMLPTQ